MTLLSTPLRVALVLFLFAQSASTVAGGQAPKDTTLKREQLAEGIYLFRAPSDLDLWTATNSVVVINERDVVVFDSNTRPITARKVIAEIRKLTSKPVRTLINSHWHMDHWSGNNEFVQAFPGLQIIATTQTRDFMKRMSVHYFTEQTGATRRRASLDSAIRTGKQADGSPLTPEVRRAREADLTDAQTLATDVAAIPRVLPTLAYRDTLVFWSGSREFRLISATGDATGSTVLYLPAEKILVMGDVLVSPEDGKGPPPWTTNSYAITPWLNSLRGLQSLDANIVVPGQGPSFRDKTYLALTGDLFASILAQVHSALERGLASLKEIQPTVNVDAIGRKYEPQSGEPSQAFKNLVAALVRKAHQEALDGAAR